MKLYSLTHSAKKLLLGISNAKGLEYHVKESLFQLHCHITNVLLIGNETTPSFKKGLFITHS